MSWKKKRGFELAEMSAKEDGASHGDGAVTLQTLGIDLRNNKDYPSI